MKIRKRGWTASLAGQADGKKSTPPYYSNPATNASRERMAVEKRLGGIAQILHGPRIQKSERQRLLLVAGQILIAFLGQERGGRVA